MTVPKPTPFDAETFQKALDENIKRPDGKPYAVFTQFRNWKLWNDKLRDYVETNRLNLRSQKTHLDKVQAEVNTLKTTVAALEVRPTSPFPESS